MRQAQKLAEQHHHIAKTLNKLASITDSDIGAYLEKLSAHFEEVGDLHQEVAEAAETTRGTDPNRAADVAGSDSVRGNPGDRGPVSRALKSVDDWGSRDSYPTGL